MMLPTTTLAPDAALLNILTDPTYPVEWTMFDGRADALHAWIALAGHHVQAPDALHAMFKQGLDPMALLTSGSNLPTPLLHVVIAHQGEALVRVVVQALVDAGRTNDLETHRPLGGNSLWEACHTMGDAAVIGLLLDAGADPTVVSWERTLLWTLSLWPETEERLEVFERLLFTPAKVLVDRQAYKDGNSTALHNAASRNNVGMVQRLLTAGAREDLLDHQGCTAYDHAVSAEATAVVDFLDERRVAMERQALSSVIDTGPDGTTVERERGRLRL